MTFKSSNVDGAEMDNEGLRKHDITEEEQNILLLEQPTPLYDVITGLQEIKQVELWSQYRPLMPKEHQDECWPMPCKEVIDREKKKKKKKAKGKLKRD
jgi:hypothetical protein